MTLRIFNTMQGLALDQYSETWTCMSASSMSELMPHSVSDRTDSHLAKGYWTKLLLQDFIQYSMIYIQYCTQHRHCSLTFACSFIYVLLCLAEVMNKESDTIVTFFILSKISSAKYQLTLHFINYQILKQSICK